MLSLQELDKINRLLLAGETPEDIAEGLGISRYTLAQRLLKSGRRIYVYRRLVDTRPADDAPALGEFIDARA